MKAGQYDCALAILSIIGTIIWINLDRLDGGVMLSIPRRGIQKLVQYSIQYIQTVDDNYGCIIKCEHTRLLLLDYYYLVVISDYLYVSLV